MSEIETRGGKKGEIPVVAADHQSDRLAEVQKMLGKMEIDPAFCKSYGLSPERIVMMNRIDPAQFFLGISDFMAGQVPAQCIKQEDLALIFRDVWRNSPGQMTYQENEVSANPSLFQKQTDRVKEELIFRDAVKRILRLALGEYYIENTQEREYDPFRIEIMRRAKNADNPENYLKSLLPAYSLINKSLATQLHVSKTPCNGKNEQYSVLFGNVLGNRTKESRQDNCFVRLGTYITDLKNSVDLFEGKDDGKTGTFDQNRSWDTIKAKTDRQNNDLEWIRDDEIRMRINSLAQKFEELKKIGPKDIIWNLQAALPTWEKLDEKKERWLYNLNPSSDEFIGATLDLIEEQIGYIEKNAPRMWKSVESEEAEKWRALWEKTLRPAREDIAVKTEKIKNIEIDIAGLDTEIGEAEKASNFISQIVKSTTDKLSKKRKKFFGNRDEFLNDVASDLDALKTSVLPHCEKILAEKKKSPATESKEISPSEIEKQALMENEEAYKNLQQDLMKELEEKRSQLSSLEKSKKEKEEKLQELKRGVGKIKESVENGVSFFNKNIEGNPGRSFINDKMMPGLVLTLEGKKVPDVV